MNAVPFEHTVGGVGSGGDEHPEPSGEVGRLLTALGVNLLTGGGGGVMAAVSKAYTAAPRASGICIGVVACASAGERARPKDGYPNRYVELPTFTHLPSSGRRGTNDLSRDHINVLSCAAIVALPGGAGTAAEVALALRYRKPVIAYAAEPAPADGFPEAVPRAGDIGEVEVYMRQHLAGAAQAALLESGRP